MTDTDKPRGNYQVNLVVYPESETVAVEQHFPHSRRESYSGELIFEGYTLEFDLPPEVAEELERQQAKKQAKVLQAEAVKT